MTSIRLRSLPARTLTRFALEAITTMIRVRVQDTSRWKPDRQKPRGVLPVIDIMLMRNAIASMATKRWGVRFPTKTTNGLPENFVRVSGWTDEQVVSGWRRVLSVVVPGARLAAPTTCPETERSKTWSIRDMGMLQGSNRYEWVPVSADRITLLVFLRTLVRRRHEGAWIRWRNKIHLPSIEGATPKRRPGILLLRRSDVSFFIAKRRMSKLQIYKKGWKRTRKTRADRAHPSFMFIEDAFRSRCQRTVC